MIDLGVAGMLARATGVSRFGPAVYGLAVAALVAAGGFGAWRAMARFDAATATIRAEAETARDNYWKAQIAGANVDAERQQAKLMAAAAAAGTRASVEIDQLQAQLEAMEARNVDIPHGTDCGLGHDRVRLLAR